jgi:hypothetical protein
MADQRIVVIVDDDHDYKDTLTKVLARSGLATRLWGCRKLKCKRCPTDQPFSEALNFIGDVYLEPKSRLVAIVLDANEYENDEYSIKALLPSIKRDSKLNHIPVVVYSLKYLSDLEDGAMRAGAHLYYSRADTPPKKAGELIAGSALKEWEGRLGHPHRPSGGSRAAGAGVS